MCCFSYYILGSTYLIFLVERDHRPHISLCIGWRIGRTLDVLPYMARDAGCAGCRWAKRTVNVKNTHTCEQGMGTLNMGTLLFCNRRANPYGMTIKQRPKLRHMRRGLVNHLLMVRECSRTTITGGGIQYHTIPYHTIPYQTVPQHTIPYRTIPYHMVLNTITR